MEVDKWLQSVGLGKYAAQFAAANVTSLHQVHALDETAIRELGVTVPGHVRRIVLAQAELGNTLQALSLDRADDDDLADEATDVMLSPKFQPPSLGIASAAPSTKAAAAAAALAAAGGSDASAAATAAAAGGARPKSKFNSTSSLYIYSTISKPDVHEIVFCVAVVLLDRIEEGEAALAATGAPPTPFQACPLGIASKTLSLLRPRRHSAAAAGAAAPPGAAPPPATAAAPAAAADADAAAAPAAAAAGAAPAAPPAAPLPAASEAPTTTAEAEAEAAEAPELSEADIFRCINAIHEQAGLSSEVLIIALLLIERLRALANLPLLLSNWQPVLAAALLVAQKVWDDASLLNLDFASVVAPYTVAELNTMEKKFLSLIEFSVSISAKTYAAYYFELRTLCEREERQFALRPLSKAEAEKLQTKTEAMEEGLKSVGVRREWASSY